MKKTPKRILKRTPAQNTAFVPNIIETLAPYFPELQPPRQLAMHPMWWADTWMNMVACFLAKTWGYRDVTPLGGEFSGSPLRPSEGQLTAIRPYFQVSRQRFIFLMDWPNGPRCVALETEARDDGPVSVARLEDGSKFFTLSEDFSASYQAKGELEDQLSYFRIFRQAKAVLDGLGEKDDAEKVKVELEEATNFLEVNARMRVM